MDILIHIKILHNLDNKLTKANFKDLVTFRISIYFIQMLKMSTHCSIQIIFEMLQ